MENVHVLGVDAAWSTTNPSGVALLECLVGKKPKLVRAGRSYTEFERGKIDWSTKVNGASPNFGALLSKCPPVGIVAIDMPLAPFHITGRREVDQALARAFGKYKAATYSPTATQPGLMALDVFDQLSALGFKWATTWMEPPVCFEVYPHASIINFFGYEERLQYKVSKKATYWPNDLPDVRTQKLIGNYIELRKQLAVRIDGLDVWLPELNTKESYKTWWLKGYEDLLDAIVCALTAYSYLRKQVLPYGDAEGVAWVPKRQERRS